MPDLTQSLKGRDFGFFKIIAQMWGLELTASDAKTGLQQLVAFLSNLEQVNEGLRQLPDPARQALEELQQNGGRLPWKLFIRRYGEVREMGAARRDREEPFRKDPSTSEILWYRALVCKAFFAPAGSQEFAYIPDDFLAFLPSQAETAAGVIGHPAKPIEKTITFLANDLLLDHICTTLAAQRMGHALDILALAERAKERVQKVKSTPKLAQPLLTSPFPLTMPIMLSLLEAGGWIDSNGLPVSEPARAILAAPRGAALCQVCQVWNRSEDFNDLRMLPGLRFEGDWKNDPNQARIAILTFLARVPRNTWWNLDSFVETIKTEAPDFQRPAGDYDSWFIHSEESDEFLRGFGHWDDVDGALVRFIICGPLHWLGVLDLASDGTTLETLFGPAYKVSAFRLSGWAAQLLDNEAPGGLIDEKGQIYVGSDARLRVERNVPRIVRYQLARFCTWEGETPEAYRYRLTPASLELARGQGLRIAHLLSLLRKSGASPPPVLVKALEGWEQFGVQARLEQVLVLRLGSPEILQALRSSRAARFLGETLGPTSIVVQPGAWEKVVQVLAEMGYLTQEPVSLGISEQAGEKGIQ